MKNEKVEIFYTGSTIARNFPTIVLDRYKFI